MKKLFFILLLGAFAFAVSAQKYYYTPSNDTIKGDTNYIPSTTGYDLKNIETGVVSFTFTHTDVADSLSYARIECRDNISDSWTAQTGNAALTATTTNGTDKIYLTPPLLYRYIRVGLACASGDTVAITTQTLMIKED